MLKDVSLSLSPGHLVALVGPNGAGKTTLLRALAGLIPSEGEIEIGGEALSSLPLRERAKRFGYLPQGHVVHWPLPARDIVALGRYPHGATDPARLSPRDAEAVLRAMQAVDVMEFSDRRVTELSGGERSRVALARVLAVEAPVILADEPTASLDPRHQIDVMKNLRATADKGVLVIVVTHDLGLAARFADHVLVLREGRLVSQGAPAEALSEQVMADVFRISAYRAEYPARGRDRAVGGSLMRRRLAVSGRDDRACVAGQRGARSRSAAHGLDECLHRPVAADAGRPRADPRIEPVFARRLAIAGAATSGAIRCCQAAPRTCCCIKPDIVVASAFDKRSTRELLKAKGLRLAELAVPRTLDEARHQIREVGDITGHPDRAAAEIARLDAALARARQRGRGAALSRAAAVAARLGGGQRQLCRLAARPKPGLRNAAGDLGFAFGGFASLEAIVNLRPDFIVVSQAGDHGER